MRKNNAYYLSVDGDTEKWYFEYLQKLINSNDKLPYTVTFNIKVGKTIYKMAKMISTPFIKKAFHICDYESEKPMHQKKFITTLQELKDYKKINPNLEYKLGYSNFTFDLWIMIHKQQQLSPYSHRDNYLTQINTIFHENFESMNEYKEEKNFKRILSQIQLEDVKFAVQNGEKIRKQHEELHDKCLQVGKFKYYPDNPDMTIQECIEIILKECKIIEYPIKK